ncbi:MAG: hypothetical protein ACYS1A_19455 [Planctomycetota bacterium]|jgi:hypothetical protein
MKNLDPPLMYRGLITLPHPNCGTNERYIREVDDQLGRDLAMHVAHTKATTKHERNRSIRELNVLIASEDEFWDIVEKTAYNLIINRNQSKPIKEYSND